MGRLVCTLAGATVVVWALVLGVPALARPAAGGAISQTGSATYPTSTPNLISLVVMGSDNRLGPPTAPSACDALHVITVNTATMKGSILNITYDYYIDGQKITDICRQKGYQTAINDLKAYSGLPLQYWAATDFRDYVQLMDAIGGLDVHVFTKLYDPSDSGANYNPGDYHMLGGDLLAFARDRADAPGSDFGRTTAGAQEILSGLNKFNSLGADLSYLFNIIRVGRQHTQFTVPLPQLIQWGMIARQMKPADFQSCTLEAQGEVINGGDDEVPVASNMPIFQQVAKDGTIPPNAQCFQAPGSSASGINWEIPPNL